VLGGLGIYVLKRALLTFPLMLAVVAINFAIIEIAPGDPLSILIGDWPASPEFISSLRAELKLDRPLPERFVSYGAAILHGDLGFSFKNRRPVLDLILERLPATILLMGSAMLLASVVGVGIGVLASLRPYSLLDNLMSTVAIIGFSMPVFWLGQILLVVFAVQLGMFPVQGITSLESQEGSIARALDVARHLVLPMIALAFRYLAVNARVTRASMLEVFQRDFIITARAKGLAERHVILGHALRNALLPVVTVIGFNFGFLLTGSVLVETIFGWPGIGVLLFDSLASRDNQVVLGIFIFGALMAVIANLLTDVAYGVLDPRVRIG
jgi:peptide/nickel transport system permease protein